jgi:NitT/TauT family transport system substrate-binding protein
LTARIPPRAEGHRARARDAVGSRAPWALAVALALACGALGGCGGREHRALRVGMNAEPGYEFAHLAESRGFFDREHVTVDLVQFESMSDSRRAFERGQLDGYFGTVYEVLQARANSDRLPRIVRVLDSSQGFDVVLARPDVANIAGLRGRTVAVEPGSLNIYLLSRALERRGMELGALRMVGMDTNDMPAALQRGTVDAAVSYPPVSTSIVSAGWARPIFSSAEIPGEVIDVLAFDEQVLASRGAEVAAFARAYDGAVAWMAGHREEACRIMAARERVSPAEFRASLDQGVELVSPSQQDAYFAPNGALSRVVEATSRLLLSTGQISRPIPPAAVLSAPAGR